MRDYPFSFEALNLFSSELPYKNVPSELMPLYRQLKGNESSLNFPAIRDDIGVFVNFLFTWVKPRNIFEFGSGYGQSAFWYLLNNNSIEKVVLTEKRDDLEEVFNKLDWPKDWMEKLEYKQGDAFKTFEQTCIDQFDFMLIDGVKADYLKFLNYSKSKLSENGLVLIDNSYWRGSFLDSAIVEKKQTARRIKELHEYLADSQEFESVFLPFEDGVTLIKRI